MHRLHLGHVTVQILKLYIYKYYSSQACSLKPEKHFHNVKKVSQENVLHLMSFSDVLNRLG